jgi:uncharacterized phage-associated protein
MLAEGLPMIEMKASCPAAVPVSAHAVAAELRKRYPGLPTLKLHKLLYYCQGYHLATFGAPLFEESLSAWDMGPVVGSLWYDEKARRPVDPGPPLGEAALNTIGYVLRRYGALTGRDLRHLTRSEAPWRLADAGRSPGTSVRIQVAWMEDYFRATAGPDEDEEIVLDADVIAEWLSGAGRTRDVAGPRDTPEQLAGRVDELRARVAKGA